MFLTSRISCIFCLLSGLVTFAFFPKTEPYPLQYPANFGGRFTIPADNPTTKEGVHLGRMLFYEKMLSADRSLSCASCHRQELAFTDGRAFSLGVDSTRTPRSAMSLANLLWVRNFFWDGRSKSLEDQAVFPLTNVHEMGLPLHDAVTRLQRSGTYPNLFRQAFGTDKITQKHIVNALAQFERTLISADSRYDRYLAGQYVPTSDEMRGMQLFENAPVPEKLTRGANCEHCHGGPKKFKELFHNNGLDSAFTDSGREQATGLASDRGRFRVPTLRNIALTAPYMHDGRFATLDEVLDHYSEHVQSSATLSTFLSGISNNAGSSQLDLTKVEKRQIIAFLDMLTDSTFINNPAFSDPHQTIKPQ